MTEAIAWTFSAWALAATVVAIVENIAARQLRAENERLRRVIARTAGPL